VSKVKFRIIAAVIAVLFVVSSFSVILNIKQHNDNEKYRSDIKSVIGSDMSTYRELYFLNTELQNEIKTKRIVIRNEASENMCHSDLSSLRIIQIEVEQLSGLGVSLYNAKKFDDYKLSDNIDSLKDFFFYLSSSKKKNSAIKRL
jgi:hypothetical protein